MTLTNIINKCKQEGVELCINGENLDIAFDNYPSDELIQLLREYKEQLISYIAEKQNNVNLCRPELKRTVPKRGDVFSSYSQDMLWFMDSLGGSASRYNMIYRIRVKGQFDISRAERAFLHIIERHEPLATNFNVNKEGKITAYLNQTTQFSIERVTLNGNSKAEQQQDLENLTKAHSKHRFSLAHDLLLKVDYAQYSEEDGVLLINMHHLASDGWSLGVLVKEFNQLYFAKSSELSQILMPLQFSYSDYAHWQRLDMAHIHEIQLSYWNNVLQDLPLLHSLPVDKVRPVEQDFRGQNHNVVLDKNTVKQLEALAAQHNCTLFMIFHAVFALLLSKYSYNEDIAIGTLLANRVDQNLESLIGFFANTVVLRTQCDNTMSFEDFLAHVRKVNLAAQDNQDVPFEKVVERINPLRSQSHTPLIQIMMAFDNTPKVDFGTQGIKFLNEPVEVNEALFDLYLKIYDKDDCMSLCFNYSVGLFDTSSIMQLADSFVNLIDSVLYQPNSQLAEMSCLPKTAGQSLAAIGCGEQVALHKIKQIHTLFERQCFATPDKVAVCFKEEQLTYEELNIRSNQLAHQLLREGLEPDSVVALYCERSLEMVIGILAILKAGAAYLPLEPSYPDTRLEYMLLDSGCKLILRPDFQANRGCFKHIAQIRYSAMPNSTENMGNLNIEHFQNEQSLAYVIYTSGSTGQPKGVMITHQGVINRIDWMQKTYQLDDQDKVLQKTPFSFDVSVWEFLWTLSFGGCLEIAEPELHKDSHYILDIIQRRKISVIHFVPSMFRHLLDNNLIEWQACTSLRHVICSGEALTPELVERHQSTNNASLHNLYGPTEVSIDVSFYNCEKNVQNNIPIGKPIQNTQLYILDKQQKALPKGAIGELYISGLGLARGYINKPDLTKQAFINLPTCYGRPQRLYRTGDLARCDSNGQFYYLGRTDNQVKLRGFRIELGEIEQSLLTISEVTSSIVTCQQDSSGNTHLVAYLVLDSKFKECEQTVNKIRSSLQEILPSYMLPSVFIPITEIPVTANGKLNKQELPKWQTYLSRMSKTHPTTETELSLTVLWGKVLDMEPQTLSNDQSFFALGGHSLSLVKLKSLIEEKFSVDIPTKKLFEIDSIAKQGELIDAFLFSQPTERAEEVAFVEEF